MRSRTNELLSLLAAIGLCTGTTVGSVLRVDDTAPPGGDGQSWSTAYRFLQDALTEAGSPISNVTQIRVAQGLYLPDRDELNPGGTDDRAATFLLVDGVLLAGGYAGIGAPDPDARDVSIYVTTLSGDLLGNDGKDFANNDENSWHVVTGSGNDDTAIIDGVTVTAGNANGGAGHNSGGGMIIHDGSPTVRNCRFESNWAAISAGGIDIWPGSPAISGSTFEGNVGEWSAGAIRCVDATSVTISNCAFIENSSQHIDYGGGGVAVQASGPGVINHVTIIGCLFFGNDAVYEGGAVVSTLDGCATMISSTVVGNNAGIAGGGLCAAAGGTLEVKNSIIYGNTAPVDPQLFVLDGGGTIVVSSSNTEGGLVGIVGVINDGGNINAPPMFVDPNGLDGDPTNDYHLAAGSPCVDTGDLASVPEGVVVDFDGNPRLVDCQVDMGAYENQAAQYAPGDTNCDGVVNFADLLNVIGSWGPCGLCPADTDHDGDVDFADVLVLISNWT
jgi:hypothetical protein